MVTMMGGHDFANDAALEPIDQVLHLQPGDRVLLTVRDGFSVEPKYIEHIRNELRERFPGVEFVVLAGVDIAAWSSGGKARFLGVDL